MSVAKQGHDAALPAATELNYENGRGGGHASAVSVLKGVGDATLSRVRGAGTHFPYQAPRRGGGGDGAGAFLLSADGASEMRVRDVSFNVIKDRDLESTVPAVRVLHGSRARMLAPSTFSAAFGV